MNTFTVILMDLFFVSQKALTEKNFNMQGVRARNSNINLAQVYTHIHVYMVQQ